MRALDYNERVRAAKYWRKSGETDVRCLLCPRDCTIPDAGFGVCGVRQNKGGSLYALNYGLASAVAIDPIEKKPLYHFHPGTATLSLGTLGCNMRCDHCQNCDISFADFKSDALRELRKLGPPDIVLMAKSKKCGGVSFTYNEPTIWIEFVLDTFRVAKRAGLYTCVITNGYIHNAPLADLLDLTDAYRVDLKFMGRRPARTLAGVNNPETILGAIKQAAQSKAHLEIVTNLVPGINDSPEDLAKMAAFISENCGTETPWHLTRYFPAAGFDAPPTPIATIERALEIARINGLKNVYAGNVKGFGGDTFCPKCAALAVRRSGYTTKIIAPLPLCGNCGYRMNFVVRAR